MALPHCCCHCWCVWGVVCGQLMMVVGGGGHRQGGEAAEWVGVSWRMVVVEEQGGLRVVWHQIEHRCLPRLLWEGAHENGKVHMRMGYIK